jgi:hypothetical protein
LYELGAGVVEVFESDKRAGVGVDAERHEFSSISRGPVS